MGRSGVTAYHLSLQSCYTGCLARFPRRMDSTALVCPPITGRALKSFPITKSFPTTVIASLAQLFVTIQPNSNWKGSHSRFTCRQT